MHNATPADLQVQECHVILDRAGIDPAHDWQGRKTKERPCDSRLAFRIYLALDSKALAQAEIDTILDNLKQMTDELMKRSGLDADTDKS